MVTLIIDNRVSSRWNSKFLLEKALSSQHIVCQVWDKPEQSYCPVFEYGYAGRSVPPDMGTCVPLGWKLHRDRHQHMDRFMSYSSLAMGNSQSSEWFLKGPCVQRAFEAILPPPYAIRLYNKVHQSGPVQGLVETNVDQHQNKIYQGESFTITLRHSTPDLSVLSLSVLTDRLGGYHLVSRKQYIEWPTLFAIRINISNSTKQYGN